MDFEKSMNFLDNYFLYKFFEIIIMQNKCSWHR